MGSIDSPVRNTGRDDDGAIGGSRRDAMVSPLPMMPASMPTRGALPLPSATVSPSYQLSPCVEIANTPRYPQTFTALTSAAT